MKKYKYETNIKLDAWDFVPGKNPVGEMTTVHIPLDKIIWFAHSASERLDISIDGTVIHLLQRDGGKNVATNEEIGRSCFNKVGCAYWIEEDVSALNERIGEILENQALWEDVREAQGRNPMDKAKIEQLGKMAKQLSRFKPSK